MADTECGLGDVLLMHVRPRADFWNGEKMKEFIPLQNDCDRSKLSVPMAVKDGRLFYQSYG